jgi:hypothetical protein
MRGLVRLAVVGFTVASLLLVGVVGVSATSSSGKAESAKVFNSLVALASSHSDRASSAKTDPGKPDSNNGKDNGKDDGKEVGLCHPPGLLHRPATPGHEHHPPPPCSGDIDHDGDHD